MESFKLANETRVRNGDISVRFVRSTATKALDSAFGGAGEGGAYAE